jgi:predicted alpha/beta hydrolase
MPEPVESQDITIAATDGYPLSATLWGGRGAGALTVIAPATAVPARFYARFAGHLAAAGRPTLTLDYRGQGASAPAALRGFPGRFRDWGIRDIPGVIDWATATYPGRPLHWVGHSFGGFGTGLAHNNARIDRLFAFASMSADMRFMRPRARFTTWPLFFVGTLAARTLGYLPGGLIGSEPMSKGAMLDWYRLCSTKGFLFGLSDAELPEKRHFATLRCPVRLSFAEDDGWVSRAGVEHLLARLGTNPDRTIWQIGPSEAGGATLGHMGFCRQTHQATLWPKALAWLGA